jgi:hypothetical protein
MANRKKSHTRNGGLRKRVARQLSELTARVGGGKKRRGPKPVREAVDRLESTVSEMRAHVRRSDNKAAATRRFSRSQTAKSSKRSTTRKPARSK